MTVLRRREVLQIFPSKSKQMILPGEYMKINLTVVQTEHHWGRSNQESHHLIYSPAPTRGNTVRQKAWDL